VSVVERIEAAIIAFAAADAYGAPWEGVPPQRLREAELARVPRREDWPRGATSDDTAQLILTARVLCCGERDLQRGFIELLAAGFPQMRGAGPTTTAAVRRWLESGQLGAGEGGTNGAAMRALPIGWGTPAGDSEGRRAKVLSISRATHGAPGALIAAGTVAAMGSWALDRVPTEGICAQAVGEAAALGSALGAEVDLAALEAAAQGAWTPPAAGISLDATETVTAVLHVLQGAEGLADAIEAAVRLGGDTDTVAAIVAGVLASQGADPASELPWLGQVQLPDANLIESLASGLAEKRG
jgi:ADP-ribosyl-[dinitrogen reductase] hydrolase